MAPANEAELVAPIWAELCEIVVAGVVLRIGLSCAARGMIGPHARIVRATQPVDFRKGPDELAALVRDAGADPSSGALYVFRAKRADRVKKG
ncbi:IS66 family insertion sequence element accessory protein TnpB [Methylocystis sp. H62]|uniref:IS66 family insertion sequence element accessory protein TnpB n=1 Tax=Methylocystis sp. H62 TaxID=2785789 RepID=UPI003916E884